MSRILGGISTSVLMVAMSQVPAAATDVLNGAVLDVSAGTDLDSNVLLDNGTLSILAPVTISGDDMTVGSGGGTINTNTNATTLNTVLSGTGNFTKSGAGTLNVVGMNTFSGATNITAGTLAISGQGRLEQSSNVSVSSGATLDVSASTAASLVQLTGDGSVVLGSKFLNVGSGNFSGVISGSGNINVNTGTLILTGSNTFTGQASSGGNGVLQIGNGGTSGVVLGNILNTNALVFNRSDNVTYDGMITGNGSNTFTGGGTYVLTSSSSGSGALSIGAGTTLQWGTGGAAGWLGASTQGINVGPVTNNGTLIINRSSDRFYQGAIGGSGNFVKQGTGMVGLTKASTYTGTTDVQGGTLLVSGSIAQSSLTTVFSGATLTGTGTVGATKVLSGAVLAAGNLATVAQNGAHVKVSSIGTLNVAGNLALNGGSTLDVKVNDAGASDKVNVTGAVTINPAALVRVRAFNGTDDGSTYGPNTSYTILSAAGGVAGQFNSTVDEQFAFLDAALSYVGNDVQLKLSRNDVQLPEVAGTPNQQAAAGALAGFDQSDPVYQQVLGLTAEQAQQAYDSTSGEVHASGQQVLDQTFDLFTSSLIGGSVGGAGGAGGARQTSALGYVEVPASSIPGIAAIEDAEQTAIMSSTLWLTPLGGLGSVKGNGNAAEIKWGAGGLALGYEAAIASGQNKVTYGAGLGYLASKGEVVDRSSRYDTQGGFAGLYGSWTDGTIGLSSNLAYGGNHVSTSRDITVGAINRTATADYWSHTVGGGIEASYGFKLTEQMTIRPVGTLDVAWTGHDDATETGAGSLNATIASASHWQVNSGLGAELEHKATLSNGADLTLKVRGMWQHALADTATSQDLALTGNPAMPLNVNGAATANDRFVLGLGVDYEMSEQTRFSLNYAGTFSKSFAAHVASASFGLKF